MHVINSTEYLAQQAKSRYYKEKEMAPILNHLYKESKFSH